MHPLALGAIGVFTGRNSQPADLERGPAAGAQRNLRIAGLAVTVGGALLVVLVRSNWALISGRSMSAAVQGLTASIGVGLLGFALLYASRERATRAA
jgi:hypothetical protein